MNIIERIKHKDIDFEKWDKTILSSPIPFVFAQSFYLNATSPNWDALIINDYESVFPITHKIKLGFNYLPQPPFTSQLGTYGKVTSEIEQAFYNYIIKEYKLIDLELNAFNTLQNEAITTKNTYIINYKNGYTFNQNTKRNVAKATEIGLKVEQIKNIEEILKLSQQYINPFLQKQVGLSSKTISVLDVLLKNALNVQSLFSFKVVDKNDNLKAIAHFVTNGKHTLYLKGTNTDKEENSGSTHLLMKHAIDFFADKSELFDFGGGNQKGLANFYMGLGGSALPYGFLQINNLPPVIKLLKR